MKIECPCGALIHDSADNLPHKAWLLADQDLDEFYALTDKPRGAANGLSLARAAYQCAACGRLIGLVVMLGLASLVFGLSFLTYGAVLVPALMVLFVMGIAMGIAATAIVLRLGPASEWLIWPIPTMVAPFAGVFYPVSVLPGWMQAISKALPPSYVFEAMRAVVKGQPAPWDQLAISAGLAVLYLGLACLLFGAVYRHAIRTGLIARYSAETVS
jgi:ABC-2 type transport system permease protein